MSGRGRVIRSWWSNVAVTGRVPGACQWRYQVRASGGGWLR